MKKIISLLLILLTLTSLSACGDDPKPGPDPERELWEELIGRWEIESYEMYEGIFTKDSAGWNIEGRILFIDRDNIDIDIKAEKPGASTSGTEFSSDSVRLQSDWRLLDTGIIEVTFEGNPAAMMKLENEKIRLTTQIGAFTLIKIADTPD